MVHEHKKDRALHRIKILQGQLRGIERMLAANAYCVDVLTQSIAIQRSLRSLDVVLLKQHLETCVRDGMKKGTGQKYINELIQLYRHTAQQ
ncbi:MAG: metal-sensing transcriptional repressor [Candidatus Yonathbacteria bacterium]|nr:metal-sensing transcriptional repressor [Candidatus Yonathbacteria bacterium]